jgi:hypothetical protein
MNTSDKPSEPGQTAKPQPSPAGKPEPHQTPREIPREQLDHQAPADPDPDDPASP